MSTDVDRDSAECPHSLGPKSASSASPIRRFFNNKKQCECSTPSCQRIDMKQMALYQLQDKLIGVALRISLYPITLILINLFITSESGIWLVAPVPVLIPTVGDVFTAITHGVQSEQGFYLTALHRALCGARGIFFAAVSRPALSVSFGTMNSRAALHLCGSLPIPRP